MRKWYVTFIVSVYFITISLAQESSNKLNGGLLFGINTSFFNTPISEYSEDYQSNIRAGIIMGLRGTYKLTRVFSLQSELLFNSKGGAYKKTDNSISVIGGDTGEKAWLHKNFQLKYIEIPIMIGVDLSNIAPSNSNSDGLDVSIKFGCAPSYNVKSAIRYNEYETTSQMGPMTEVDSEYTTVNFPVAEDFCISLLGELSFNFNKNGNNPMFIDIRYTQTLNNVYTLEHWNNHNMETTVGTVSFIYGLYFRNLYSYK